MTACTCYPGGFSPTTYEGPQHHCALHGHGNGLDPADCPSCRSERVSEVPPALLCCCVWYDMPSVGYPLVIHPLCAVHGEPS